MCERLGKATVSFDSIRFDSIHNLLPIYLLIRNKSDVQGESMKKVRYWVYVRQKMLSVSHRMHLSRTRTKLQSTIPLNVIKCLPSAYHTNTACINTPCFCNLHTHNLSNTWISKRCSIRAMVEESIQDSIQWSIFGTPSSLVLSSNLTSILISIPDSIFYSDPHSPVCFASAVRQAFKTNCSMQTRIKMGRTSSLHLPCKRKSFANSHYCVNFGIVLTAIFHQ